MKKILITIILSVSTMLFTGCKEYNLRLEPKFVENESIRYISNKEEKLKVEIVSSKSFNLIKKKPTTKFTGQGVTLIANNSFAENVLKEVMSQYFKKVDIIAENEINKDNLIIKPTLINFEWEPIGGGQKSVFSIDIKVYLKNKEILNKVFNGIYEETSLIATILNDEELVSYMKSKNLFKFYNEEFIPDLAKALKENQ